MSLLPYIIACKSVYMSNGGKMCQKVSKIEKYYFSLQRHCLNKFQTSDFDHKIFWLAYKSNWKKIFGINCPKFLDLYASIYGTFFCSAELVIQASGPRTQSGWEIGWETLLKTISYQFSLLSLDMFVSSLWE